MHIAWNYSPICKPKESFAFHSRKAVKCGRKVPPSNLSLNSLSLQCRTRESKENFCVSVLVWYTTIPVDHNLIYTLECARQPAQIWEILALSLLPAPCLSSSGGFCFLSFSVLTARKGVISKGTLVPTKQSKWHLWAWHADAAVPVSCRIWALTSNCSWGWLRTFKWQRVFCIIRLLDFSFIYVASLKNIPCDTEGTHGETMQDARMCFHKYIYADTYIIKIQFSIAKIGCLKTWGWEDINDYSLGSSPHLNNPGIALELRLID